MGVDMKRKVLLSSLLLAIVVLLTEFFVLNNYLPSVRPSKTYSENLIEQYVKQKRSHLNFTLRSRAENGKQHDKATAKPTVLPVKTTNRPKTSSDPQIRNMAQHLSSLLKSEVKALKRRKVLKKEREMLGQINGITRVNSRGQTRLKHFRNDVKSRDFKRLKGSKLVLIYTPLFGDFPWKGLRNTFQFTHFRGKPCPVTNCSLTYRRSLLSRSDVVVFHAQDMPPVYELEELNDRRPKGQIWVYLVLENPSNARDTYFLEDMFNWTVTYEKNSDVYLPYGSYAALKPGEKSPYGEINPRQKNRLAVWTVSNCGGLRDWFVQELKKYIRVDIFGSCADYIYQPHLEDDEECIKHTPECENLLKRYKFQLAFENGYCVDYITEKYWGTPLELGLVPVVLGGANYTQMTIPGSYVNALDFDSVKALAEYLLYLDKNDTAYMEYFAWRKKFKVYGYLKAEVFNDHYPWTCELCAKAQKLENKTYRSLSNFRDPSKLCGLHEDKIYEMLPPQYGNGFLNPYGEGDQYYGTDESETDADDEDEDGGVEEDGEVEGDEGIAVEEETEKDAKVKNEGGDNAQNSDKNQHKVGGEKVREEKGEKYANDGEGLVVNKKTEKDAKVKDEGENKAHYSDKENKEKVGVKEEGEKERKRKLNEREGVTVKEETGTGVNVKDGEGDKAQNSDKKEQNAGTEKVREKGERFANKGEGVAVIEETKKGVKGEEVGRDKTQNRSRNEQKVAEAEVREKEGERSANKGEEVAVKDETKKDVKGEEVGRDKTKNRPRNEQSVGVKKKGEEQEKKVDEGKGKNRKGRN